MVYLREEVLDEGGNIVEEGVGLTSVDKKHDHPIYFDGEMWVVEEVDDHTHGVIDYFPSKKRKKKSTDFDKMSRAIGLFKEADTLEEKSREDGEESEDFYAGKQWDKGDKDELHKQDRAALTINEIGSKIDLLSGFQRQNRSDFKFYPIEEGDTRVADLLDEVVKNITDNTGFSAAESLVFKDMLITGRGVFNVYVEYDSDPQGKIIIERLNWRDVFFGPHEKLDLADCEYAIKTKMYSVAKVKQMWPEKEDDIEQMMKTVVEMKRTLRDNPRDQYDGANGAVEQFSNDTTNIDTAKQQIRVMETWEKRYRTVFAVTNVEDNFVISVDNMSQRDAKRFESIPGILTIRRNMYDMVVTKTAGTVLLSEDVEDIPSFPFVPVYAKKIGNYFWGKVEDVKDVQREINKRHSQATDILNKVASYGWIYDSTTFDPHEEDNFRNNSSRPGFTAKVRDLRKIPVRLEGVKTPVELVNLEQMASEKLRQIINVPIEAQGFSDREVSGRAIIERRRQTLAANEYLFDNLNMSKQMIARILLYYIHEIYTPERILRLVDDSKVTDEQEQMDNYLNQQAALELLANADLTRYDVVVSQSPQSETIRAANFAILVELAKQGFPVPHAVIIEASDFPDKERILGQMEQEAQAAAQAEQSKNQTEVLKSMPEDIQRQMIAPQQGAQGVPPVQ